MLRQALGTPRAAEQLGSLRTAAVSVLLIEGGDSGVELLLIRRSERESDPFSGHMAFPGGHRDPIDASLLETALRETKEEIGLDLTQHAELLGSLDDLSPMKQSGIMVRPFVFALARPPELQISSEVESVLFARMSELASGASAAEYELLREGKTFRFPAFRVGTRVVWGLTYRVLETLISRVRPR